MPLDKELRLEIEEQVTLREGIIHGLRADLVAAQVKLSQAETARDGLRQGILLAVRSWQGRLLDEPAAWQYPLAHAMDLPIDGLIREAAGAEEEN